MDTSPCAQREPLLPPPSKRKTPSTPRSEESLEETVLNYNDRITALETKFHNILTAVEKLSADYAAKHEALAKFMDLVQAHIQQTTSWIAEVSANNPSIAPLSTSAPASLNNGQ